MHVSALWKKPVYTVYTVYIVYIVYSLTPKADDQVCSARSLRKSQTLAYATPQEVSSNSAQGNNSNKTVKIF